MDKPTLSQIKRWENDPFTKLFFRMLQSHQQDLYKALMYNQNGAEKRLTEVQGIHQLIDDIVIHDRFVGWLNQYTEVDVNE